jgi:hypothetical protein
MSYLPQDGNHLPSVIKDKKSDSDFSTERDILYKVLFDMKSDLNDLKKLTLELMKNGAKVQDINPSLIQKVYGKRRRNFFEEEPITQLFHQKIFQEEFEDDEDQNYFLQKPLKKKKHLKLEQKKLNSSKKP